MKNDFKTQLEVFSYPDSEEQSQKYMEKYWLHNEEYSQKWQPLQSGIFNPDKYFPDLVFKQELDILIIGGGLLFNQEDFERFKICLQEIGDSEFVIIQQIDKNDPPKIYSLNEGWAEHPYLRFKYPADITWEELLSGGGISDELFKTPYKEYLLFGNKAEWGMYVANDYKYPLVIFGFKPEYNRIFKNTFKSSDNEKGEILNALPLNYRKYI